MTEAGRIPNALSVAGSDPSGGAGVQADLKTFCALRVYGMAAITALTAQNTRGVSAIHAPPPAFIAAQLAAIRDDIRTDAMKIGMIANAGIGAAVADVLAEGGFGPVVIDPVMVAKGGHRLLEPDAAATLRRRLLPLAAVITPNLEEAAALLGGQPVRRREEMPSQARRLLALGPRAVLLKGGHLDSEESPDLLLADGEEIWLEGARTRTAATHGTGCTLSAALAARLAHGDTLRDAALLAKSYVAGAILHAGLLSVGSGHGPTHHFHALWGR